MAERAELFPRGNLETSMRKPELEVGPENICLVYDAGSTAIKFGFFNIKTAGEIEATRGSGADDNWFNLLAQERECGEFKWKECDGNALHAQMEAKIQPLLVELGISRDELGHLTTTGLVHSLAVEYNGVVKIIHEKPVLQTDFTAEEQAFLAQVFGVEDAEEFQLREDCALMKILTLAKNPQIVEAMFGPGVSFSDLKVSNMAGVLLGNLAGENGDIGIPEAFLYSITGDRSSTVEEANLLLEKLGQRFGFSNDHVRVISDEEASYNRLYRQALRGTGQEEGERGVFELRPFTRVHSVTDFGAEMTSHRHLIELGIIPPASLIISLDTVGKEVAYLNLEPPQVWKYCGAVGLKTYSGPVAADKEGSMVYAIHPIAAMYNDWVRGGLSQGAEGSQPLWSGEDDISNQFYRLFEEVLREGHDETDSPFYFDPLGRDCNPGDSIKASGEKIGALYIAEIKEVDQPGGGARKEEVMRQMSRLEALTLPPEQRKQIIRAIVRDTFFSVRNHIDRMRSQPEFDLDFAKQVFLYGGMVHSRECLNMAVECFGPGVEVNIMDMRSCMAAAVQHVARITGKSMEQIAIPPISKIAIGDDYAKGGYVLTDRTARYYQWLGTMRKKSCCIGMPPVLGTSCSDRLEERERVGSDILTQPEPAIDELSLIQKLLGRSIKRTEDVAEIVISLDLAKTINLAGKIAQAKGLLLIEDLLKQGALPIIITKSALLHLNSNG